MEALWPYIGIAIIVGGSFQVGFLLLSGLWQLGRYFYYSWKIRKHEKILEKVQTDKGEWAYMPVMIDGSRNFEVMLWRDNEYISDSVLCTVYDEPDAEMIVKALNKERKRK